MSGWPLPWRPSPTALGRTNPRSGAGNPESSALPTTWIAACWTCPRSSSARGGRIQGWTRRPRAWWPRWSRRWLNCVRMSEAEKRRGSTLVLTDQTSKSAGTPALHQTQCGASVRVNPRQVQFVGQSECCSLTSAACRSCPRPTGAACDRTSAVWRTSACIGRKPVNFNFVVHLTRPC